MFLSKVAFYLDCSEVAHNQFVGISRCLHHIDQYMYRKNLTGKAKKSRTAMTLQRENLASRTSVIRAKTNRNRKEKKNAGTIKCLWSKINSPPRIHTKVIKIKTGKNE